MAVAKPGTIKQYDQFQAQVARQTFLLKHSHFVGRNQGDQIVR
jgi:hypothetical protein